MPELPEVETIACGLREALPGKRVERVRVIQPSVLRPRDPVTFAQVLTGARIESVGRHGKLIVLNFETGQGRRSVVAHLKLTGSLRLVPAGSDVTTHTHVVFPVSGNGGQVDLQFRDIRRFGYLELTDPEGLRGILEGLGPDALDMSKKEFVRLLAAHRGMVKLVLMDQRLIAGIGNIYSNEGLFEARIHPWRPASALSQEEAQRLHSGLRKVIRRSIECGGSTVANYEATDGSPGSFQREHRVYQKDFCPRCGGKITREVKGGRPAYFCPRCQPLKPGKAT